MTKQYDRAYFDKWYRSRRHRVHDRAEVRRKVALAVTTAEYFLRRPIENVLDIGCGEGAWYPHLRALRRKVKYTGIDSSDYAVRRFGTDRNIRKGSFGALRVLKGSFDLVVCSDVLHYLSDREIKSGLPHLLRLTEGVAFLEVLTRDDDIVGDLDQMYQRRSAWYRRTFMRAGLVAVGSYCWLSPDVAGTASELEIVKPRT